MSLVNVPNGYLALFNETTVNANNSTFDRLLVQGDYVNDLTVKSTVGTTSLNVDTVSDEVTGSNLNFDNIECKTFQMTTAPTSGYFLKSDASGNASWSDISVSAVTSATGTADQVLINGTSGVATSGPITLTLPQSIGTSSNVTFNNIAGTLTTASQPNVTTMSNLTSIGTLSSLTVSGLATTGTLKLNSIANTTAGNVLYYDSTTKSVTYGSAPTSSITSIVGTANQVIVTNGSGPTVTLSGPQDLATSSSPTFTNVSVTTAFNANANFNGASVQTVLKNASTGTGAYEELQILNSANLGLRFGQTSPLYTGWTGDSFIYNSNNAGIMFGTNNSPTMYLTSGGNLGIGAFTKATAPSNRLHTLTTTGNNYLLIENTNNAGQSALDLKRGSTEWIMYVPGGQTTLQIYNNTLATDAMILNTSGHVGIGNTPGCRLHVQGSSGELFRVTDGSRTLYMGCDANEPWFGTSTNNSIRFVTNGTEKMRLGNNGFLGIGCTPTTALLQIAGTYGSLGLDLASSDLYANMRVIRNNNSPYDTHMYIGYGSGATSNLYFYSNNTQALVLSGGNSLTMNGTLLVTSACTVQGNLNCQGTYQRFGTACQMLMSGSATLSYNATSGSFAHGLGTTPDVVMVYLECTSAINGYAVGDIIPYMGSEWVSGNFNINIWFNSTTIGYVRAGNFPVITSRSGAFPAFNASSANFQLRFRYYRNI